MQGSLDHPPMILRGSRWRGAVSLIGSSMFVAISLFSIAMGQATAALYLSLTFFGLLGALGLWLLISPARLEIGPAGLRQTVLWRRTLYSWNDVHDFRPATVGLFNKTVGFDFLVERPKRAGIRKLNAAIVGVQGALQSGWELDPHTLANVLNNAREQWLPQAAGVQAAGPAIIAPPVSAGFAGARMNRKVYVLSTAAIFALVIGVSSIPGVGHGASSGASIFLLRIYAARLHDIGRSGWWQLTLYMVQIPVIVIATVAGSLPLTIALLLGLLVQLVFSLILAAIPGQPGPNRFGPPPGQPTAVGQSEAFR